MGMVGPIEMPSPWIERALIHVLQSHVVSLTLADVRVRILPIHINHRGRAAKIGQVTKTLQHEHTRGAPLRCCRHS